MIKKEPFRIPWDQFFMIQAIMLSTRATCLRRHVGAVIVKGGRVIAEGYNGSVSGAKHCTQVGCLMIDGHCKRTVDAEQNALMQCAKFGESCDGAKIYVTDFPCLRCTKLLLQAGIKSINFLRNYRNNPYARQLIKLKHIDLNQIRFDPETIKQISNINFRGYLKK